MEARSPPSNPNWSPVGAQTGEGFGNSVAPAGDENGDGYADVLVGAPNYDATGNMDAGRLFVYSSNAAGFAAGSTTQTGTFADENLDLALYGAGDVNGDRYRRGRNVVDAAGERAGRQHSLLVPRSHPLPAHPRLRRDSLALVLRRQQGARQVRCALSDALADVVGRKLFEGELCQR